MTEEEKPPPGFSAFRKFLEKLANVSKREIDEKEAEYRLEKETNRSRKSAG